MSSRSGEEKYFSEPNGTCQRAFIVSPSGPAVQDANRDEIISWSPITQCLCLTGTTEYCDAVIDGNNSPLCSTLHFTKDFLGFYIIWSNLRIGCIYWAVICGELCRIQLCTSPPWPSLSPVLTEQRELQIIDIPKSETGLSFGLLVLREQWVNKCSWNFIVASSQYGNCSGHNTILHLNVSLTPNSIPPTISKHLWELAMTQVPPKSTPLFEQWMVNFHPVQCSAIELARGPFLTSSLSRRPVSPQALLSPETWQGYNGYKAFHGQSVFYPGGLSCRTCKVPGLKKLGISI